MVTFYIVLLHVAFLFVVPFMLLRASFSPVYRGMFLQRMGFIPDRIRRERGAEEARRSSMTLWVHCASVGEVIALGPLLKKIEERVPAGNIALSTMTKTGMDIAMKMYKGVGLFFFLPFDLPWAMGRAIRKIRPKAIVIMETELWPNFLLEAKKWNVPVLLVNGRISKRSFRGYMMVRSLFRRGLEAVTTAAMQSDEDREKLVALGARSETTFVTGNIKFDSLSATFMRPAVDGILGNCLRDRELFIAGSTHRGEEEVILDAFTRIIKSRPQAKLLLAPRHIERTEEVVSLIARYGFTYVRRTELDHVLNQERGDRKLPDVVVLDTIGELAGIYSYGRAVFVGGSLIPQGGHNVLEPALGGKIVLFGPHMENFKEARDLLLTSGGGTLVRNSDDIQREVIKALQHPEEQDKKGIAARQAISQRQGAAQRNFSLLEPYL